MFSQRERNYLQEQTIPEIIKNTFSVYRHYFRQIFIAYVVIVFPAFVMGLVLINKMVDPRWALTSLAAYFFVYFLFSTIATMAITVIVADVCLGNAPGLRRTWNRLSIKSMAKLLATTLLFYLILFGCCLLGILLILGGFYLSPNFPWLLTIVSASTILWIILSTIVIVTLTLFYPPVGVLEKRWGINALRRSAQLGRGYYFRSLFTFLFMSLFIYAGIYAFQAIAAALMGLTGTILGHVVSFVIGPLPLIYVVLLYYDLRVRKEGYDVETLEADLRR